MSTAVTNPLRYLARVSIEFETPFIVGGGSDAIYFDDVFVSDANGLPALPGSSLAGILRHAWVDAGYDDGKTLFGFQNGTDGQGSRLSVSWGCLHDSSNRPVEGIIMERAELDRDPVLREARMLTARDHVRINHTGAAASGGKFDERSVSAGHRFTFELMLEGNKGDRGNWDHLLGLLRSPAIRIGGKTRRGYGQFRVIRLEQECFDLSDAVQFRCFGTLPVDLAVKSQLRQEDPQDAAPANGAVSATLALKPEAFWMIGGGFDGDVDLAPLKANRIVWENGSGRVDANRAIVPGSAVKGALSHRVAFHYNRLTDVFADAGADPAKHTGENNRAVGELFGCVKNDGGGQRGRVIISDLFVAKPGEQKILNHVSIDRFTGGARVLEGALFDEKPFYQGDGFTLTVTVAESGKISDKKIREAFDCALRDLAEGRLAIGAGAGRGNGFFRGELNWNDAGLTWLAGGAQ